MPELPEVETIVQDLRPVVEGRRIENVELRFPAIVRHPEPEEFRRELRGRRMGTLSRRGKYMLFGLDSPQLLVIHLGMTGQLTHTTAEELIKPHTHAILDLEGGTQLRYRDVRRFGRLLLGSEAELTALRKLPKLGPEPIDPDFRPLDLYQRLRGRRAPLKVLLLDQAVVSGVGNIYADESCFAARIRPDRPAGRLSRQAVGRLHGALRDSLLQGIVNRGSSVSDYVDGRGDPGRQQEGLLVYGRGGEPCATCGRPLAAIRLAGRTTVFCRRCQR